MNINGIIKNMKDMKIRLLIICMLISSISVQAQTVFSYWQGKISIGDSPVLMHGDIVLKSDGELYTGSGKLEITGRYRGESGSKVYRYITAETENLSRFLDVSDGVEGSTEIIPEINTDWDGSPVELIKAKQDKPDVDVFHIQPVMPDCGEYYVQLQHEVNEIYSFWSVTGTKTLPLIKQLRNHTLLVNNNPDTNGGHSFTYYRWYKDGQPLTEGFHDEHGGSYYTGGASLDADAVYTVEAMDVDGKHYFFCPYQYVPVSLPTSIKVYPNPVRKDVARVYMEVETSDETMLEHAIIEVYGYAGQYYGRVEAKGLHTIPIDLPQESGVYILKFKSGEMETGLKVIVE
jgi:hypothetical protein